MRHRVAVAAAASVAVLSTSVGVATTAAAAGSTVVTVTGQVQVLASYAVGRGEHMSTTLRSHGRTYTLQLPDASSPVTGSTVQVTGTVTGHTLHASTVSVRAAAPPVATTGQQTVYVIRAYWAGGAPATPTASDVSAAFDDAGSWFNEVSYGQLPGLTTTVSAAWRHIGTPPACTNTDTNNIWTNAVAAETAAVPSFDPDAYQHVVVYFPYFASCSFAGLALIRGQKMWLNGATGGSSSLDLRVTTHETGHNLGLYHSHSVTCYSNANHDVLVTVSAFCSTPVDYGDPTDVMGGGDLFLAPHYSASQKATLGWLGGDVAAVAPCTTVALDPYEVPAVAGDLAARIDAGIDPATDQALTYWLEYRHPGAGTVDATAPSGPLPAGITDGVLLHETDARVLGSGLNVGPDVLDATPGSDSGNPGGDGDFDDAAIPVGSTVTTPEGYGLHVDSAGASGASVTLTTTKPSVPQTVSAAHASPGAKVSWTAPGCDGGASVSAYDVRVDGGAPSTSSGTSLTLPGVDESTEHTFTVTARNTDAESSTAALVPTAKPVITKSEPAKYGAQGGAITFEPSISNGGRTIIGYHVVAAPIGGGATKDNYYLYGDPNSTSFELYVPMAAGKTYKVTLAPTYDDVTDGTKTPVIQMTGADAAAPKPTMKAPTSTTTLAANATVTWGATDTGGSGVQSYDVRYRKAASTTGFGSYVSLADKTTTTSTTVPMAAGSTYCFSVRARDGNNNLSGYSAEKCTSRPVDDAVLTAAGTWSRGAAGGSYLGTLSTSTHRGASLSRTHLRGKHLLLLVTTCGTCGKVSVFVGSSKIATIDLHANGTHDKVLKSVTLPSALANDTVKLKVATAGKPVKIDGLVVRAV